VSGRIQTRSYDHKDGYKVYVTEVVAEEIKFLEWGNKESNTSDSSYASSFDDMTPIEDDSIPF
jgi:single-strand DNA-binding protein